MQYVKLPCFSGSFYPQSSVPMSQLYTHCMLQYILDKTDTVFSMEPTFVSDEELNLSSF